MAKNKQIIQKKDTNCENCGWETHDAFCENCGQRKQGRFTIAYILGELIALLNYDKGFFYNFYYLTSRPVQSLSDYLKGKTKTFYPPLPYFLTATTILILLLVFGAEYIGKHFAENVSYVFEVKTVEKEIEDTKSAYYKKRKTQQIEISELTRQLDSLRDEDSAITQPLGDSLYKKVHLWLLDSKKHQENLKMLSKKEDEKAHIGKIRYGILYLLPFFFALIVFFTFRKKSNLLFTEHLIIQLYTFSQTIWLICLSLGVVLWVSWTYKLLAKTNEIPESLSLIYLIFIGLVSVGGLIAGGYVSWQCAKQGFKVGLEVKCANCGHETHANYCPQCGQRKQERFTFDYILGEILAVLSYDKGLITNFVHLALRPSRTIIAYLNGKTKPYYPPLSYFLTAMTIGIIAVSIATGSWEQVDVSILEDSEAVEKKRIEANYAKDRIIFENRLRLLDSLYGESYRRNPAELSLLVHSEVGRDSIYRSFSYTNTVDNLIRHNDDEIRVISKSGVERRVALYGVFYGTPVYLTLLVFVLYFTKKLYLTEHLIIQLFLCAQGVWYAILLFLLLAGINLFVLPLFIQGYTFTALPTSSRLFFILGYVAVLLGWYYYTSIACYKQAWWLVLIKCLLMLIAVAVMSIAASFLGLQLVN
ncbi:MAG: hypothetical protein OHK0057_07280 [Thermoflexibacter sp.]